MSPVARSQALALVLCAALPLHALAEDAPPTGPRSARLLLPLCPDDGLDATVLIEVLAVELAGQGIELGGADEPSARLVVDLPRCQAGGPVVLRVEAPEGASIERLLPLEQGPGRERVLALALAELLRREWPALVAPLGPGAAPELPRAPAPAPDGLSGEERAAVLELLEARAASAPSPPPPPPSPPPRLLVDVQIDGRIVPAFETGLVGLTLGLSVQLGASPARLEVDAGAWYGLASDPLGKVDLVAASGAVSLLVGSRRRPWSAAIGPRVELGYAGARGRPIDETVTAGSGGAFLAAVALEVALRFRLTEGSRRGLWLLVDGTVGYLVAGLEASAAGRAAAALEGLVVGLSLGLSFEAAR